MINRRTRWTGNLLLLGALLLGGGGCEKKKAADKAPAGDAAAAAAAPGDAAAGTALAPAPAPDTTAGGAAAPGAESAVIAELHTLRDQACACKDTACAEAVQTRLEQFIDKVKDVKPTGNDAELAGRYVEQMMECVVKLMGADVPGPSDEPAAAAPPAPTGSTGLPSCDDYVAAVGKFAACDKAPKETRDATSASITQMQGAWSQMAGMPEDVKKQANEACKQAVDGLRQGAKALGCDL